MRASDEHFDVIIADLFQPARDGSGALYTVEHFRAVAERLSDDGLFCQWLPLYQMDTATLRLILRTYLEVWPEGFACMAHFNLGMPILGLFSGPTADWGAGWFENRVADPHLAAGLEVAALADDLDLLGGFVAGPQELARYAGPGPLNTDDHPRVVFEAPRFSYDKRNDSHSRMVDLLERTDGGLAGFIEPPDGPFAERLSAYLRARDRFLGAGLAASRGDLQGQVDGLVEALERSDEFETAFAIAIRLSHSPQLSDAVATELLDRLAALRPDDGRVALARAQR